MPRAHRWPMEARGQAMAGGNLAAGQVFTKR
jgi:hypothetical protein